MPFRRTFAVLLATAAAAAAPSLAQGAGMEEGADTADGAQRVVVTGQRASLVSAQSIRRDASGIVDAVVAPDILKLPDLSVVEALQRVTGVQIARDRGDGAGVTVRGLSQIETLLNGREVFTAGTGRALNFADLSAETVSRIEVHKTASADQIEGGVGGLVDVRTRRPFDVPAGQAALTVRATQGDLVQRTGAHAAWLTSQRWAVGEGGEVGALLSLSWQQREWREDLKSTGRPVARAWDAGSATLPIAPPGGLPTVLAPSGTSETLSAGQRERTAALGIVEWRPVPGLALYGEAHVARFTTRQDSHQINVFTAAAAGDTVSLFPGRDEVGRVTWRDAPVSILSFARDTVDRVEQYAVGGHWDLAAWRLRADASHTESHNALVFSGPFLAATAAAFEQDVRSAVPSTRLVGADLLDPAQLRFTGIAYRRVPFHGRLDALQLDAERALDGAVDAVQSGWRHARRQATNAPGLIFGDAPVDIAGDAQPGSLMRRPGDNLLPGSTSLNGFLVGDLSAARDVTAYRARFGLPPPPTAGDRLGVWDIEETSDAAYLQAPWRADAGRLSGLAGVRVVHTRHAVQGWQNEPVSGEVLPIATAGRQTDWLPSLQLRWGPGGAWVARAAASATVTRPDFNQLSPSLVLLRNTAAPPPTGCDDTPHSGTAGNPSLGPVRARGVDLALEHHAGANQYAAVTAFRKRAEGFAATVRRCEWYGGVPYLVARPANSDPADITGAELAFQRFFDAWPGWLGGFGMQANYTYVSSDKPHSALGGGTPLPNLSRHSANLVAMYERGPLSARLAYQWRDRFLTGVDQVQGLATPVYTRAYGWLDGSFVWRWDARLSFAVEGANLLRTRRSSYLGEAFRTRDVWLNDRQVGVAMMLSL